MLYQVLRAVASIALRWYYADVAVQGRERVPRTGPLVIVANHPNALIDPLLVGTATSRQVLLTAKATLFGNPLLALLLKAVGVVPLRRAKDEQAAAIGAADAARLAPARERNADSFRLVTAALRGGNAILVFPEGISHDDPSIAPLRSGAARMALQARSEGASGLRLVAMGLVFEEKERPGSRVLVRIGDPLDLDDWLSSHDESDAAALTAALDARLREVTLNFASAERAARAVNLARTLVAIASDPSTLDAPPALDPEAGIARRIDAAITALAVAPPAVVAAADALTGRLAAMELDLRGRGLTLSDVRISPRLRPGLRFVVREGTWALVGLVVAVLGGLTHWLPLRVARGLALGSLRSDSSRDQPAMRTILLGLGLVLAWYVSIAMVVVHWRGWAVAAGVLAVMFAAAHADRLLRGRIRRAVQRARTYLAFRSDPSLQPRILAELDELLGRALTLESDLVNSGPRIQREIGFRG